jgi:hypothetical protein
LREQVWATNSVTLGWDVKGVWEEGADGTDVNCCALSTVPGRSDLSSFIDSATGVRGPVPEDKIACLPADGGPPLLATSDDYGQVKLFQYPVVVDQSESVTLPGHSSHVMAVTFAAGDSAVLSAGGLDMAAIAWRMGDPATFPTADASDGWQAAYLAQLGVERARLDTQAAAVEAAAAAVPEPAEGAPPAPKPVPVLPMSDDVKAYKPTVQTTRSTFNMGGARRPSAVR